MRFSILLLSTSLLLSEARVTFPNSEVIQASDLINKKAAFKCINGCRVYVDLKADFMKITDNGGVISEFNAIIGGDGFAPKGLDLPAGANYGVEYQGLDVTIPKFVLYAVDNKAPNFKTPVFVPQKTIGVTNNNPPRYFTILSSFDATQFYSFNGTFSAGYPKIYTTGFDSVGELECHPVYEARTQYQAEQSWPMIYAPIITVDYGYEGVHSATAYQKTGKIDILKNGYASTVYMSPGYVSCSFDQNAYFSPVNSIDDSFTLEADSLDVTAIASGVDAVETVYFSVNKDIMDMVGSTSINRHYGPGTFDVKLSYTRATPASGFSIQLDFGTKTDLLTTTKAGRSVGVGLAVLVIPFFLY